MEPLEPYQLEGVKWLKAKRMRLLADEMGLGKSAQSITASDELALGRICVICPAVARINWQREFNLWSILSREFHIVETRQKTWPKNRDIITSFELAAFAEDSGEFDLLIVDEAHFLKNLNASRTAKILSSTGLVRKCKRFWALTGTPAPNHVGELWLIAYLFGRTSLSRHAFTERYCLTLPSRYGEPKVIGNRRENISELKKLLEPIMLRRTKDQVMNQLPPLKYKHVVVKPGRVDLDVHCSFAEWTTPVDRSQELKIQLAKEMAILEAVWTNAPKEDRNVAAVMHGLSTLQVAVPTLRRYLGLSKIYPIVDTLKRELNSNAYKKVVIFAVHRDVIITLRHELRDLGAVVLFGNLKPKTKQRNLDRFKTNPKYRVMIANIIAAGTAIDLTSANQVVFAEQDWVPGNNAQAVMRVHRRGQKEPVFVRNFSTDHHLDIRITQNLQRKIRSLTEVLV